jgi:hypothetical protein
MGRFRIFAGGSGFLKRPETTQMKSVALHLDLRLPTMATHRINAGDPGFVVNAAPRVPRIYGVIRLAKIAESVVELVAVDVVNKLRPTSIHDGERHPVGEEGLAHNAASFVTARKGGKGGLPGEQVAPTRVLHGWMTHVRKAGKRTRTPAKFSRQGIILKKLAANLGGDISSVSHSAVLSRGGQGRALFPQRFRPALYGRLIVRSQARGAPWAS